MKSWLTFYFKLSRFYQQKHTARRKTHDTLCIFITFLALLNKTHCVSYWQRHWRCDYKRMQLLQLKRATPMFRVPTSERFLFEYIISTMWMCTKAITHYGSNLQRNETYYVDRVSTRHVRKFSCNLTKVVTIVIYVITVRHIYCITPNTVIRTARSYHSWNVSIRRAGRALVDSSRQLSKYWSTAIRQWFPHSLLYLLGVRRVTNRWGYHATVAAHP